MEQCGANGEGQGRELGRHNGRNTSRIDAYPVVQLHHWDVSEVLVATTSQHRRGQGSDLGQDWIMQYQLLNGSVSRCYEALCELDLVFLQSSLLLDSFPSARTSEGNGVWE